MFGPVRWCKGGSVNPRIAAAVALEGVLAAIAGMLAVKRVVEAGRDVQGSKAIAVRTARREV